MYWCSLDMVFTITGWYREGSKHSEGSVDHPSQAHVRYTGYTQISRQGNVWPFVKHQCSRMK